MTLLLAGAALLIVTLFILAPMARGIGSLRDRFWALVVLVLLALLAVGMVREDAQVLGWST